MIHHCVFINRRYTTAPFIAVVTGHKGLMPGDSKTTYASFILNAKATIITPFVLALNFSTVVPIAFITPKNTE